MIRDEFRDLHDDTGRFKFGGWRCIICGHIDDPVISANQTLHPPPTGGKKRKFILGVN